MRSSATVGASNGRGGEGEIFYDTIRFENNTYDSPAGMDFWWDGRGLTYNQWLALGNQ